MTQTRDTSTRLWRLVGPLCGAGVGALFVLTGYAKLVDPGLFIKEVRAYGLVPVEWTHALAYILPWLEIFAGGLLLSRLWKREARALLAGMLVVFTFAKAYAYFAHQLVECGCGGRFAFLQPIFNNPQGLATNIALLVLLGIDHYADRITAQTRAPAAAETPVGPDDNPPRSEVAAGARRR